MKKIIRLTESDLYRIIQRVINEQTSEDQISKEFEEMVLKYINEKKEISADWVFKTDLKTASEGTKDLAIGSRTITKDPDFNRLKWDDLIKSYREGKTEVLSQLMNFVRNGTVIIKPYNGGKLTPAKFVPSGEKFFKIVYCPECVKYVNT